jgi:hypothetical protein
VRYNLPLALLFAAGSVFAEIPEIPEIAGKVVDAASGRPIPGAIVVAKVGGDGGSMFGHGHFRQLHCTAVRADVDGRFRIPAWTWSGRRSMSLDRYGANFSAYHPDYTIYAPGGPSGLHHPVRRIPLVGTLRKPSEAVVPMHRFTKGDANAWGFKLGLPIDDFGCDWDADVSNTDLVWEAMREEVAAFDAENPRRPLMWKLNLKTKRPEPPPPTLEHRSIGIRSPTDRGSSIPAQQPSTR